MNSNKNLNQEKKKTFNDVVITRNHVDIESDKQEKDFNNPDVKNDWKKDEKNSGSDRGKKPIKQVKFKNTPEKIQINEQFSDEYEEQEPYELTKPKNDVNFDFNENKEENNFEPVRPKV